MNTSGPARLEREDERKEWNKKRTGEDNEDRERVDHSLLWPW